MKKTIIHTLMLILFLGLVACNSDEEEVIDESRTTSDNEVSKDESNDESTNEQEENNSDDVVAEALKQYPDAVRLDEVIEYESEDAATKDHINQKINHFYFTDDIDGVEPSKDSFLVVNITIENLIDDYFYGVNFLSSVARDDKRTTYQRETGELEEELTDEGDGASTGDIIYDVNESKYYRISMHGDEEFILFPDEADEAP